MTTFFDSAKLTPLQDEVMHAFSATSPEFFLTGGAVLVGFVFGHRTTDDLDFFTSQTDGLDAAHSRLLLVAQGLNARVESLLTSPTHRRYLLTRDEDSVRVDLVVDLAPQLHSKIVIDGVRCDTVEEILVNKLCALVGRSEIRDLVDLMWLERAGHSIEAHLEEATKKDGGFSPATAAWILSNVRIIPQRVPAGTDADELEAFRASIEARLRRLAFPTNGA